MVELIAKTPCAGLLPLTIGGLTLREVVPDRMVLIAPFRGRTPDLGLPFPGPGETHTRGGSRIIWMSRAQALLIADEIPDLAWGAAVTDQTDAYAIVRIEGSAVEAVLARLTPVDLRLRVFTQGRTARTMVGHMWASVTRVGDEAFEIMAMRSMAATLVHDLARAATGIALR